MPSHQPRAGGDDPPMWFFSSASELRPAFGIPRMTFHGGSAPAGSIAVPPADRPCLKAAAEVEVSSAVLEDVLA